MKLLQRIGYYLVGFAIGLVILAFIFNKKRTSCSYGPEARVLKNINSKPLIFSDEILRTDSTLIKKVLKNGEVNFSESDTRKEPCGFYQIEDKRNGQPIVLTIENCDSLVKILSFKK